MIISSWLHWILFLAFLAKEEVKTNSSAVDQSVSIWTVLAQLKIKKLKCVIKKKEPKCKVLIVFLIAFPFFYPLMMPSAKFIHRSGHSSTALFGKGNYTNKSFPQSSYCLKVKSLNALLDWLISCRQNKENWVFRNHLMAEGIQTLIQDGRPLSKKNWRESQALSQHLWWRGLHFDNSQEAEKIWTKHLSLVL